MFQIESSGYPEWVKNDKDKAKFIQNCYEQEGIELDQTKIKKNPGLRFVDYCT